MQVTKKTDIVSWRLTRQDLWDGFNLFYDHYILICIPAFAIRLLVNDVFFPTGNKIPAPPHKKKKAVERTCKEFGHKAAVGIDSSFLLYTYSPEGKTNLQTGTSLQSEHKRAVLVYIHSRE